MDIVDLADRQIQDNLLVALAGLKHDQSMQQQFSHSTTECVSCGEEIPRERLAAIPKCNLCVNCAQKKETQQSAYKSGYLYADTTMHLDDYLF